MHLHVLRQQAIAPMPVLWANMSWEAQHHPSDRLEQATTDLGDNVI